MVIARGRRPLASWALHQDGRMECSLIRRAKNAVNTIKDIPKRGLLIPYDRPWRLFHAIQSSDYPRMAA